MRIVDREKFVKLANRRINSAIKAIQLIGNLSNRSNYDFTEEDVDKIFTALNREVKQCRERFKVDGSGLRPRFELK